MSRDALDFGALASGRAPPAGDRRGAPSERTSTLSADGRPAPTGPRSTAGLFDAMDGFEEDKSAGPLWAVPWSDLMMVMFVVFASLVAVQQRDVPQPEPVVQNAPEYIPVTVPVTVPQAERRLVESPRANPSLEPLTRLDLLGQSEAVVREAGLDNIDVALIGDSAVKVSVQGPMFFELGEAELRPELRGFLDKLAEVIARTPFDVEVVGHTDDYPVATSEFPSNWELSLARAARVARYLIEQGQMDPARFTAMGRSQYAPAVPNLDDANRALNRRVEIIITGRERGRTE